jgi:hypothetical protein
MMAAVQRGDAAEDDSQGHGPEAIIKAAIERK